MNPLNIADAKAAVAARLAAGAKLNAATCTHHTDQQRAACPVCLVATLTAERDQLRAELATERARLDYLQEWGFDFLTRAAIDAAMKEGAK